MRYVPMQRNSKSIALESKLTHYPFDGGELEIVVEGMCAAGGRERACRGSGWWCRSRV